jgi:hypothetical protein
LGWAAWRARSIARELPGVGAPLVGFGTESFRDPAAGAVIAAELKSLQNADAPVTKGRMAEAQVEVDMNSSHRS